MRLNWNKKRILLIPVLVLLLVLSGCTAAPTPEITPEPEETSAPGGGYHARFTEVGEFSAGFMALYAGEDGFYGITLEKTGEVIPEAVINEAKRKNRPVVNDGRYDVIEEKLWFIGPNGKLRELKNYQPLPAAENTGNWKSFSSQSSCCALRVNSRGYLETLECITVSGNSVPANRAQYVPGKNYYEYEKNWFIRKLTKTGKEVSKRSVSPEDAAVFLRQESSANLGELLPERYGISPGAICSPVWTAGSDYCFLISSVDSARGKELVSVVRISYETYMDHSEQPVVLKLSASASTARLKNAVAKFNRTHEKICIEITPEDTAADLYALDSAEYTRMAQQGKLANLYPFIDKDGGLKRSLFLPNILKAMEVNGGLYATCAGFSVDTAMGISSLVGDHAGWTYEELLAAWNEQGIGTDAFDVTVTRQDVLHACLQASMNRLIDSENGTGHFDSEEFRQILSFARNFRAAYDYDGNWRTSDATDLRVRNGRQLLLTRTIYNFADAALCGYEFAEPFSYKGYPTLSGTGNLLNVSTLDAGINLAMRADCANPEAAWQFLRTFFTEEYQAEYSFFPSRQKLFEAQLGEAMQFAYVLDKNGNIAINERTREPMIISTGEIYLSDWTTVYLYPISAEKGAKLKEMATTATARIGAQDELLVLIEHEAEAFFQGQATIEEVQARAQAAAEAYLSANINHQPLETPSAS